MIAKYYIIVTKDKDGFTVPYTEKGKPPELFLTQDAAASKLRFIQGCFEQKSTMFQKNRVLVSSARPNSCQQPKNRRKKCVGLLRTRKFKG